MASKNPLIAPVLKWVGGKRQLLEQIRPFIPSKFSTYYEPFVGGGAVLFDLAPKKAIINDFNSELINVYLMIKEKPEELIDLLENHKRLNSEEYYYSVRELDRNKEEYEKLSNLEKASRIIYLNKTCFNGLFRVNSSGEFNSPWGKYKNPNITCDTTIRALHKYFSEKDVTILTGDYESSLNTVTKKDFVYFDPPYMPISNSSSFTGYTSNGFGKEEQERLKRVCDKLNEKGVRFLQSNSDCDFIKELYSDYKVYEVDAKRLINADAKKRGEIKEVLICNYEFDKKEDC